MIRSFHSLNDFLYYKICKFKNKKNKKNSKSKKKKKNCIFFPYCKIDLSNPYQYCQGISDYDIFANVDQSSIFNKFIFKKKKEKNKIHNLIEHGMFLMESEKKLRIR